MSSLGCCDKADLPYYILVIAGFFLFDTVFLSGFESGDSKQTTNS